jgi:Zn-dependent M16 (insulinase) family peptidase
MIKNLFPGNNSYISQTGGKLSNLRTSTTIEKVRAYHKKFYRPENLYITVTGNVEGKQVFAALDSVERKILSKRTNNEEEPYERPFQKPLEKVEKDVTATVQYPSKDEKFGSVSMGWRLPGQLWEVIPTIQVMNYNTLFSKKAKPIALEHEKPYRYMYI